MGGMLNQSGVCVMLVVVIVMQVGVLVVFVMLVGVIFLSGNVIGVNDFFGCFIFILIFKVVVIYIFNLSFMIKKGIFICCMFDIVMNSDVFGFVSCIVLKFVYGMDGKVVFVDWGSIIDGEMVKGLECGKKWV